MKPKAKRRTRKRYIVTLAWLELIGACIEARRKFKRRFGDQVTLTRKLLLGRGFPSDGDVLWFAPLWLEGRNAMRWTTLRREQQNRCVQRRGECICHVNAKRDLADLLFPLKK